ncbi:MAG: tetraacyldisaccharide 4'-kinase [SAR86 cluster bacterium]|uniref:Tetraacyldisaccharide 4'-kinase n=1 Tax=SAR86 cluster bacterium TaxID=2030880 RepID=A0A2A5AU19_9GAMM|nr:MAG: tetraacyldisaccharide 4'-kinase [SAR86 cluster bacterium]
MNFLEKAWEQKAGWLVLLLPVSALFQLLAGIRRKQQEVKKATSSHKVPVIVFGNISVGGTGKTPLLMTTACELKELGFKPGIISRGYGGEATSYPLQINKKTSVNEAGDEAFLTAEKTLCPVVVDPDRNAALNFLLENNDVDVVLSDDGLQHYKMYRDIEIAVIDGQRLFGNGYCMPAGPLRESPKRLKEVDHVVVNGQAAENLDVLKSAITMQLEPRFLVNLCSGQKKPFIGAPFNMGNKVQAVSALGNPQRFYDLLARLPYQLETFSFPDHHPFSLDDFEQRGIDEHQPVVMTEKDAVKCRAFARPNYWYLAVDVQIDKSFIELLADQIKKLTSAH